MDRPGETEPDKPVDVAGLPGDNALGGPGDSELGREELDRPADNTGGITGEEAVDDME